MIQTLSIKDQTGFSTISFFFFSISSYMSVPKLETIEIILFPNGVAEIALNRPKRYNALTPQSYTVIQK